MATRDKVRYREICDARADIPLFMQAWWLDVTAGVEGWDALVVEDPGALKAVWALPIRAGGGAKSVYQPKMTQALGIKLFYPEGQKYQARLSYEKQTIGELVDALEALIGPDHFTQLFHHRFSNWLPFYWRGYQQTTYYTYRIPSCGDETTLWNAMSSKLRNEIRNAEKKFEVETTADPHALLELFNATYRRRRIAAPISGSLIEAAVKAAAARGQGRVAVARDDSGKPVSAILVVNDAQSAYYLIGGTDYSSGKANANSMLLWHAIREASVRNLDFDFEGSMNEGIEHFFSSFGALQVPYFKITKEPKTVGRYLRKAAGLALAKAGLRGANRDSGAAST